MGFVDRGGGREAKGSSLRRSKKNPGAPTTKHKSANKNYTTPATRATTTPPPTCVSILEALTVPAAEEAEASAVTRWEKALAVARDAVHNCGLLHVDAAVALLSRKLEDDQEGVFRRAVEDAHLAAMVCWCGEVERQSLLLDTCVEHNKLYRTALVQQHGSADGGARHVHFMGDSASPSRDVLTSITTATTASASSTTSGIILYAVLGIHVNNIDRSNMRLHDQWMKELESNAKHGDVVGILTGINLSRDHGTHYAQERLFNECWRVAAQVHVPLVLHLHAADAAALTETVNRASELLAELISSTSTSTDTPSAVVLYNGLRPLHASTAMQQLVRLHRPGAEKTAGNVPFYVMATADGLSKAKSEDEKSSVADPGKSELSVNELAALLPPRVHPGPDPASATAASSSGGGEDDTVVHLSQLLIGTGAPWGTPQNLPDADLCALPNEPGNYTYVMQTVLDAMKAPTASTTTALTLADLSAVALVNNASVFFHEYNAAHQQQQQRRCDTQAMADAEQQQQWVESQQPAAPTAVAGLKDSETRRDLEALLAEAAKEREQVEQERLREEEARERARSEGLQEKRNKREKKKNVKANNRSNFTHFRNKDFAPRQIRQENVAHLQDTAAHEDTPPSSSSSETSGSDIAVDGPNSLEAEVKALLRESAAHHDTDHRMQQQPARRSKGRRKGKDVDGR